MQIHGYNSSVHCLSGEVVGVLCGVGGEGVCGVGGEGVCGELLPCITSGIQGNLERDSGEAEEQPHLIQKLSSSSSSDSADDNDRVNTLDI